MHTYINKKHRKRNVSKGKTKEENTRNFDQSHSIMDGNGITLLTTTSTIQYNIVITLFTHKTRATKNHTILAMASSGFSLSSTAEEVTHGIDGTGLTAIVTGLHIYIYIYHYYYFSFNFIILLCLVRVKYEK